MTSRYGDRLPGGPDSDDRNPDDIVNGEHVAQ